MKTSNLPIAIIGAGPIGLAAAAHLSARNKSFIIIESGSQIGDNVKSWEHVSMFSPWKYNLDDASTHILKNYGWKKPRLNRIPYGHELLEQYLIPLSETDEIKPFLQLNTKVTAISRRRISKMKNFGREKAPFVLFVNRDGLSDTIYARAIIDASGTWKNPNPIGANGLPAKGELENKDQIFYGIPEVLGKHLNRYKSKEVIVIGGGHSAINTLLELADLKKEHPNTKLNWVLRKAKVEDAYGGLDADELPGRGRVGQRIKELVDMGEVEVFTPFFIEEVIRDNDKIKITGESQKGSKVISSDEIIAATGLRPDLQMLSELRVEINSSIESPMKLAPLIDPNVHSCGSVEPHGEAELKHPEKDFYIVGMKSYGRAPTFLLATGYEQVRSVAAALSGDWKAAKEVQLDLPETGVCGVPAAIDPNSLSTIKEETSSCC